MNKLLFTILFLFFFAGQSYAQLSQNDTIIVATVIYNGDTIIAKTLENVSFMAHMNAAQRARSREYDRLRNAVYVTYPYARRAGAIMNDINYKLRNIKDESKRKAYIKSREKDLKREFSDPITNLSVYQGKVLMKLINRQTGNNCYEIIKEYKGGVTARFYQTVAFFFSSNLKQSYDEEGDDRVMETFVQEVQRMYGYDDIRLAKNATFVEQTLLN